MGMRRAGLAVLVFAGAFFRLSYNVSDVGLANGYIDPVSRIAAQDEALYSHVVFRMIEDGDWLTPKFLGRYALVKPPLLYWASAVPALWMDPVALAVRLPSLLAGALVPALLFFWVGGLRGLLAAVLLLSNPLWHILSRVCLTDALLALFVTLSMAALPAGRPAGYSVSLAAAILTKGIAAGISAAALGLWLLVEAGERGNWRKWAAALAAGMALASPWFLYQWWVHPKWFWAEFVNVEVLGFSFGAPPQTSEESHLLFYGSRLARMDYVLLLFALAAAPSLAKSFRQSARARVLVVWMAAAVIAIFANQYRNIAYLLPALPALSWMAAEFGPFGSRRRAAAALGLLAGVFALRAANPEQAWGFSFAKGSTIAVAPALDRYAALQRERELILIDAGDEFYAATLGIRRVRYCFPANEAAYRRYGLDFRYLGVALTTEEFLSRNRLEPEFARRLAEWGLPSTEPIGTVILAGSDKDAVGLIEASPQADFLVPAAILGLLSRHKHEIREAAAGRVFLLAR
jgi:hypothetical protein